jgi:hypothetical protein
VSNPAWWECLSYCNKLVDATDSNYIEIECTVVDAAAGHIMVGIGSDYTLAFPHNSPNSYMYYAHGSIWNGGSSSSYGSSWLSVGTHNIGILLKNGKLYFRVDGVWQNSADVDSETGFAFSGLTGSFNVLFSVSGDTDPNAYGTLNNTSGLLVYSLPTGASVWGQL